MGLNIDMPLAGYVGINSFTVNTFRAAGTAVPNSLIVLDEDDDSTDYLVTFPTEDDSNLSPGDVIKVKNNTTTVTVTIDPGTVEGVADTITLDDPDVDFEMIYVDSTFGWAVMQYGG